MILFSDRDLYDSQYLWHILWLNFPRLYISVGMFKRCDAPRSQEWGQATSLAKAFSIGAREAEAVSNLMTKIEQDIVEKLCSSVRQRGMSRFLSHEAIARSVFNTGWSSGILGCEAWKDEFTNLKDGKLASWF